MERPSIAVLYLHHRADELTKYHYELLHQWNAADEGVTLIPICFPEYAGQCLAESYVPQHLAEFRHNYLPIFQRFRHEGRAILADLDCLLWDWVLYGGQRADRIILAEGDMLSRCSIREFFGPSFQHPLSGSVSRLGLAANQGWSWFKHGFPEHTAQFGQHVASVTPVCGIQLQWELAEQLAKLVQAAAGAYDDLHIELLIPSLAKTLGVDVAETVVPVGLQASYYIDWTSKHLRTSRWGIFHPVKKLHVTTEALPQPSRPLTVITLWRPDWSTTQQAVLEYLLEENFPQGTQLIWTMEPCSPTAALLDGMASHPKLQRYFIEFLEVELDVEPRVKHDVVAFLYNQTLAAVEAGLVLLIEDDVVAEKGTWDHLSATWQTLNEDRAACMVAYRSRTRPNFICAGDLATGYVPWQGQREAPPQQVSWVGGGYTLYDATAVKLCLPVVARNQGSWTKGWDVDLCEKLRAGRGQCYVLESVVAEHRFS